MWEGFIKKYSLIKPYAVSGFRIILLSSIDPHQKAERYHLSEFEAGFSNCSLILNGWKNIKPYIQTKTLYK